MHTSLQELFAVRQTAQAGRFDLYAGIHKGVRLMIGDLLAEAGRVDPDDTVAVQALAAHVAGFATFCAEHLEHENRFIHPALERAEGGASQRIAAEHAEHERDIETLRTQAGALATCAPAGRAGLCQALYHALSLFAAHNLVHMYIEETEHNAVLWAHYSDAEILALEHQILASLSPQQSMEVLHWMIPAVSPAERLVLLQGVRASAPPQAFDAVLGLARDRLEAADWARLAAALGVPANGAQSH